MLREMYRKLEEERKEVKTELTQAFADISNKGLVEQNKQLRRLQSQEYHFMSLDS